MKVLHLLGIGIAAALTVAACDNGSTGALQPGGTDHHSTPGDDDDDDTAAGSSGKTTSGGTTPGDTTGTTGPNAPVPTNSPDGLAFYKASVHPTLASKCAACHGTAGPGPNWLTAADANATYKQLFSQGYVITSSRITVKGTHDGSTTNALSTTEIATYNQWVGMETAGGGAKATVNVLATLGACFDQTKFNAMQMGNWRTTQRTGNNNTNQVTPWNENANNCTGCNNAPCSTCHSSDPATNFVNAEGSNLLPPGTTFSESKSTAPAYISKYFGISPDGKPVASDGIKKKSDATKLAKAYSHPMFTLNTQQQAALDAFVTDTIAKYTSTNGACAATTTTTPPPANP